MTDKTQLLREALESYEHAIANGHREHDALSAFANISVPDLARAALSAPAQPASGEAVASLQHNLKHSASTVSGWLAGGCDASQTPRFHIAVLATWADESADLAGKVATPPASQEQADPWKTEAMGKMSRIEESMTLLADKLEQASQEQAQPAQCDGGTCGLGGYCDKCPKQAQPSGEVVAPRLIGWRTENFLWETDDADRARNWEPNIGVLPIFEGDPNTKLTAPQPAQPAARVAMTDEQANAIDRAIQLCEWIGETPHQRGSINGLAMQVAHELRGITSNGATAQPDHPKP